MPAVCFYFQVHQPFRVKPYSYLNIGRDHNYFDDHKNAEIARKVANKCYLPTNRLLLELINQHKGKFKISYSITGVAIDQFQRYCPEVLESFLDLAKTGCVEFLGETYYHSLASLFSVQEFEKQVALHSSLMEQLFNVKPTIFRNTELVYSDEIGKLVHRMGFKAQIAEGADDIIGWRSPNFVYKHPENDMKLLLKNYRLSDDIAFRFSNRAWNEYPLTAEKFASWVHRVSGGGEVVNLFMDYETFGEHQWECTGIFDFLRHLPEKVLAHPDWTFETPSEVIDRLDAVSEMPFKRVTSWADMERDLTAWTGNRMQEKALDQAYALAPMVYAFNDPFVTETWRKLLTSDHFYYMCTKWFADGDVHAYFNAFDSPYDAFISYMNVLNDFKEHFLGIKRGDSLPEHLYQAILQGASESATSNG